MSFFSSHINVALILISYLIVVCVVCPMLSMSTFARSCFFSWSDGSPCDYTAPSKRAFKRHLETKHQVKLSVRGRGPFTPLTATERALSRINVSNRAAQTVLVFAKSSAARRRPDRAPARPPSGLASFRHLMRQRDIFLMVTGRPPPS